MRTLKILEHISLDGVIQHTAEDSFPHSNWTVPFRSLAGMDAVLAAQGTRFDLLPGRRTYDLWSEHWPKAPASPMADSIAAATKYAAIHLPESLALGPSRQLGPEIVDGVHRINAQDMVLCEGASLTSTPAGTGPCR